MPAAVRGRGTLVAVGYPIAALLVIGLWIDLHGAQFTTSLPVVVLLVVLAALTEQVSVVITPRIQASPAAGFITASALVGGPLVGALAGVSLNTFTSEDVSRKRFAWGGADALQGFTIGLVGQQLVLHGGRGALALAALGLLIGCAVNAINMLIVVLDRPGLDWSQIVAVWRTHLAIWMLPWAPLSAFLVSYRSSPTVALALAAGLLVAVWFGNRVRLRLEQRLADERALARCDALTGAPNRHALDEALAVEHARILRGGYPACVCFLDIDRFKAVNTDYGYSAADQVLIAIYRRLRERLRASDQIFRWGGEEFVLIAPDQSDLRDFAERLRLLVGDEPFAIGEQQIAITVSVGAAVLDETRTPEGVVEAASRLVQIAKEARNTVEVESASTDGAAARFKKQVAATAE